MKVKMNILLIQPPIRDFYHTRQRMYPLGLLYLASSLKMAGFSCRLFDAFSPDKKKTLPIPEPLGYLKKYYPPEDKSPFRLFGHFYHFGLEDDRIYEELQRADLVGISSLFTPYEGEVLHIAQMAKGLGKLVVLGGNHATVVAEHLLENSAVDYVICGEGEERLPALCEAIGGGRKCESIDGLGYRVKNKIRVIPPKGVLSDLDSLPFPDRSLLNPDGYHFCGRRYTMILSGRGCPYNCRFCSGHAVMGRGIRFRSIDNILAEMRLCRDLYKINIFDFEDENFSLHKSRTIQLLDAIEAEFGGDDKFALLFENGLFPESLDSEILARLKRLGCNHLNLPLVSSSDQTLKQLKRPGSGKSFVRAVRKASQDFFITGYLILGLPQSDLEEMIQSIRFLADQQVLIAPSIFYATPGMDLYSECETKGLLPINSFLPLRSSAFPIETEHFQRLDLVTLFRVVRVINFIKSLIDESQLKGTIELSQFLRAELQNFSDYYFDSADQKIIVSRPFSKKELGLILLSKCMAPAPVYYQIRKIREKPVRWVYQLIRQEYSVNVWEQFDNRMTQSNIRGITNPDLSLIWDLNF